MLIRKNHVTHIGHLDSANRKTRWSLEGPCISVSQDPDAWRGIARISGEQWEMSSERALWLDASNLSDEEEADIAQWAQDMGYLEPVDVWRAWSFDEEASDWRFMSFPTKQEALNEVDEAKVAGAPTDTGEPFDMVPGFKLTDIAMSRLERWADPLDGLGGAVILYGREKVAADHPDVVGIWWDEIDDPLSLSCPRGGVFPERLGLLDVTNEYGCKPEIMPGPPPAFIRPFYSTCVSWPSENMDAKEYLDDNARDITREDFLTRVDPTVMAELSESLGYGGALLMEDDPYVSYHLDEATGIPYFCWSAIEHVFAEDHEIDSLQERLMNKENTPAKPIMLVEDLARMRGQDPIDWRLDGGDLSDEMLENLARHDGPILLLEGATAPPVYQQVALKRILDEAGPERVLKLDWSEPPDDDQVLDIINAEIKKKGWEPATVSWYSWRLPSDDTCNSYGM